MPRIIALTYGDRAAREDDAPAWSRMIEDIRTLPYTVGGVSIFLEPGETAAAAAAELLSFCTAKGVKIEHVDSAEFFFTYVAAAKLRELVLNAINAKLRDRLNHHFECRDKTSAFIANTTRQAATDLPERAPQEERLTSIMDSLVYVLEVISKNMQDSAFSGRSIPLYEGDQQAPPDGRVISNDIASRIANYIARTNFIEDLPEDVLAYIAQIGADEIKETAKFNFGDEYIVRQQDRENAYDDIVREAYRLWTTCKALQAEIDLTVFAELDGALLDDDWSSYEEDNRIAALVTAASARRTAFYEQRNGALASFKWIQRAMQMIIVALSTLYDDYNAGSVMVQEAEIALNAGPIDVTSQDTATAIILLDEYVKNPPPPPPPHAPPRAIKIGPPPPLPPPLSPRAEQAQKDKRAAELAEMKRKADDIAEQERLRLANEAELKRIADDLAEQERLRLANEAELKRIADDLAEQERLRLLKEAEEERQKKLAEEAAKRAAATVVIAPLPPPPSSKTTSDLKGDPLNEDNY
jgi:hypothetical protein